MSATSRPSKGVFTWCRNVFGDRQRKRRAADKSRQARRRALEPLEIRIVLNGLPPWAELPPDRLDFAIEESLSAADTGWPAQDLGSQISDLRFRISDLRSQSQSQSQSQISNLKSQISNLRFPVSNLKFRIPSPKSRI